MIVQAPDHSVRVNPYVGFRPFFADDALYFFGRTEQTRALLDLLRETRFVPVLGSSGSGKSSLVLSGVIPTLQGGFMVADRDRWLVVVTRPGDAPLENFARALHKALGTPLDETGQAAFAERIRSEGESAVLSLLATRLGPHDNVLVLADQFEEIFTFRAAAGSDEDDAPGTIISDVRAADRVRRRGDSQAYVSLLVSLSRQQSLPAYVISTMRTDFLGDCDRFAGLPELINRAGYLVPRLTRKQLRETIEGPARLKQVRVAPRLVDYVLNAVGDRSDMLPILQHAMHRTWETWMADGSSGPLDQSHLQKAGGLQRALSVEADALIASFDAEMVGRVFKRLTRSDLHERRVRRPTRRSDLFAVAAAPEADVQRLLDLLSAEGTNFLYGSADGKPDDPRYDISHESLIRQWERLRVWIDEERELVKWYTELCEKAARLRDNGEFDELSLLAMRRQKKRFQQSAVNAVWASRYDDELPATWTDVQRYLARNRRRRWRLRATYGLAAVAVLAAVMLFNQRLAEAAARSRELRLLAALDRLIDTDPTYAGRLAVEIPIDRIGGHSVLAVLDRLEHKAQAAAEFSGVTAFTPIADGNEVVLGMREGFAIIVASDGRDAPLARLDFPGDTAVSIAAPSAGSIFISLGSGRTLHWHVAKGETKAHVLDLGSPMSRAQLLADSSRVAILTYDGDLFLWSPGQTERRIRAMQNVTEFATHPTDANQLVVSRFALSTFAVDVGLLDLRSRRFDAKFRMDENFVSSLQFVSDGNAVLALSADGGLTRYEIATARQTRFANSARVIQVGPSGLPGEVLLTLDDGLVAVVSDDSLRIMRSATRHADAARAYAVPGSAWVLSGTDEGDVRLTSSVDSSTAVSLHGRVGGGELQELRATEGYLFRLESGGQLRTWHTDLTMFHTAPPVLIESSARSARLVPLTHDVVSVNGFGRPEHSRHGADTSSADTTQFEEVAAVSDSGNVMLLCAMETPCRVWHVNSRAYSANLTAAEDSVYAARFAPQGRWLATQLRGGRLQLRSLPSAEGRREFAVDTSGVGIPWGFSADGRYLAFRSSDGVSVVDLAVATLSTVPVTKERASSIMWGPSGARLAITSGSTVTIHHWDGRGQRRSRTWTPRPGAATAVRAIDATGSWAALDHGGRGLRIVRLDSTQIAPRSLLLEGPRSGVLEVQFPADSNAVLATTATGETYVWQWRAGSADDGLASRTLGQRLLDWTLRSTGSATESPVLNDGVVVTRRVLRHHAAPPRRPPPAVVEAVLSDSGRRVISLVHVPWQRPRIAEWPLSWEPRAERAFGAYSRCLDTAAVERDLAEFGVLESSDRGCAMSSVDRAPRAALTAVRVDTVLPREGKSYDAKAAPRFK